MGGTDGAEFFEERRGGGEGRGLLLVLEGEVAAVVIGDEHLGDAIPV